MRNPLAAVAAALALAAGTGVQAAAPGAQSPAAEAATPAKAAAGRKAGEPRAADKAGAARPAAGNDAAGATEVRRLMERKFPGAEIRHVARTPHLGLYEVLLDGQLVYTDARASTVFVGSLFDTDRKVNITQERLQELTAISWSDLPLELAIKTVKGKGSRRLAVFSDVDCPFCRRLENELKDMDDLTVYTFLFPIASLHPDAHRKSKLVWCAEDRKKSYDELMLNGTAPASSAECDDPVARILALGEKLRISATPTLVFADGRIVPGALPRAQLEAQLARAEGAAKKAN